MTLQHLKVRTSGGITFTCFAQEEPNVDEFNLTVSEGGTMEAGVDFKIVIDSAMLKDLIETNSVADYAVVFSIEPKKEEPIVP